MAIEVRVIGLGPPSSPESPLVVRVGGIRRVDEGTRFTATVEHRGKTEIVQVKIAVDLNHYFWQPDIVTLSRKIADFVGAGRCCVHHMMVGHWNGTPCHGLAPAEATPVWWKPEPEIEVIATA